MVRKVKKGSNVYVYNPQRFVPDCCSITGEAIRIVRVRRVDSDIKWVTVRGCVAKIGGGYDIDATFRYEDIGVRIGTPVSQISTQPGTPGYSEWLRISESWGY